MSTYQARKNALSRFKFSRNRLMSTTALIAAGALGVIPGAANAKDVADTDVIILENTAPSEFREGYSEYTSSGRIVDNAIQEDIGRLGHTHFDAPLSVITGVEDGVMTILGKLTSTGEVMLLDTSGFLFGSDSVIDTQGFAAIGGQLSAGTNPQVDVKFDVDVSDDASITIEQGARINISEAGLAAFVAPTVSNRGIINARMGTVELAAGNTVTLDLYGDSLVEIAVDGEIEKALIENKGTIAAEGGIVRVTSTAAKDAVDNLINMEGVTTVASASVQGGKIVLSGGDVQVAGSLDASSDEGAGEVEITAQNIELADTSEISVDGGQNGDGGTVLARADEALIFRGEISAEGGALGGDGGHVSLIGSNGAVTGDIKIGAANGQAGSAYIDPEDVCVTDGSACVNTDGVMTVATTTITGVLNPGGTFTVETGAGTSGDGDAEIADSITTNTTAVGTLIVNAHDDVWVNKSITDTGLGLNVILNADFDNSGDLAPGAGSSVFVNAAVSTNGGDFTANASDDVHINEAVHAGTGNATLNANAGTAGTSLVRFGTSGNVTGEDVTIIAEDLELAILGGNKITATNLNIQRSSEGTVGFDDNTQDMDINQAEFDNIAVTNLTIGHPTAGSNNVTDIVVDNVDITGSVSGLTTLNALEDDGTDDNVIFKRDVAINALTVNADDDARIDNDSTLTLAGAGIFNTDTNGGNVGDFELGENAMLMAGGNNITVNSGHDISLDNGAMIDAQGGNVDLNLDGSGAFSSADGDSVKTSGTGTIDIDQTVNGSIRNAIAAIANSGTGLSTVNLGTGTFTESVLVDRAVQVIGVDKASTTVSAPTTADNAFTVDGTINGDVKIADLKISDSKNGIEVLDTAVGLDLLNVDGVHFVDNSLTGVRVNGAGAASTKIQNSMFLDNGQGGGSAGEGDILFWLHNGNIELKDLNIQSNSPSGLADYGIQIRGSDTFAQSGDIKIENVKVSGDYRAAQIGIQRFTGLKSLTMSGVELGGQTDDGTDSAGWGSLYFSNIGTGDFNLGDTTYNGGTSLFYQHIINDSEANFDATGNTFDGVAAADLTLAQSFDVEDKVFHALDDGTKGLVTWQDGKLFVTQLSGSIQRGIDAASVDDDIYVDAGTFVENVVVNKDVDLLTVNTGISAKTNLGDRGPETVVQGTGGTAVTIDGIDNFELDGFTIQADDGQIGVASNNAAGVKVQNNIIERKAGVTSGRGVKNIGGSITVSHNLIRNLDDHAVSSAFSTSTTISNNQIEDVAQHAIFLVDGTDDTVSDNMINRAGSDAVHAVGGQKIAVTGNMIDTTGDDGIDLNGALDTTVTGNTLASIVDEGIEVFIDEDETEATKTLIDDNTVNGTNVGTGIWVQNVDDSTVTNNTLEEIGVDGIRVESVIGSDDRTSIGYNTITKTFDDGIHVIGGDFAEIYSNTIEGAGFKETGGLDADDTGADGIRAEKVGLGLDLVPLLAASTEGYGEGSVADDADLKIYDNAISIVKDDGIDAVENNIVYINTNLIGHTGGDGIHVEDFFVTEVSDNSITSTGEAGIEIDGRDLFDFGLLTVSEVSTEPVLAPKEESVYAGVFNNKILLTTQAGIDVESVGNEIGSAAVTLASYGGNDAYGWNVNIDGNEVVMTGAQGIRAQANGSTRVANNDVLMAGMDSATLFTVIREINDLAALAIDPPVGPPAFVLQAQALELLEPSFELPFWNGTNGIDVRGASQNGPNGWAIEVHNNNVSYTGGHGIRVSEADNAYVYDNDVKYAGVRATRHEGHDSLLDLLSTGPFAPEQHGLGGGGFSGGSVALALVSEEESEYASWTEDAPSRRNLWVGQSLIETVGDHVVPDEITEYVTRDGIRVENIGNDDGLVIWPGSYAGGILEEPDKPKDKEGPSVNIFEYNVVLQGNTVDHTGDDGIDVRNITGRVLIGGYNKETEGNTVTNAGYGDGEVYGSGDDTGADGIVVSNVYESSYYGGPGVGYEAGPVIDPYYGGGEPVYVGYTVDVIGNTVDITGDDGIEIYDAESTLITQNTTSNNGVGRDEPDDDEPEFDPFTEYGGADYYGADGIHVRNIGPQNDGPVIWNPWLLTASAEAGPVPTPGGIFIPYAVVIDGNIIDNTGDDGIEVVGAGRTFITKNVISDVGVIGSGYFGYYGGGEELRTLNDDDGYFYFGGYFGARDGYGGDGIHVRDVFQGDAFVEPDIRENTEISQGGLIVESAKGIFAVDIYDNDIDRTGDDGIEVVNAGRTIIEDNEIDDAGYYGGGDYYGADGIHVRNVYQDERNASDDYDYFDTVAITSAGAGGLDIEPYYGGGPAIFGSDFAVEIIDNEIDGTGDDGAEVLNSGRTLIEDNDIEDVGEFSPEYVSYYSNFNSRYYYSYDSGSYGRFSDESGWGADAISVRNIVDDREFVIIDDYYGGGSYYGAGAGYYGGPVDGPDGFDPFDPYALVVYDNDIDRTGDDGIEIVGVNGRVLIEANEIDDIGLGGVSDTYNSEYYDEETYYYGYGYYGYYGYYGADYYYSSYSSSEQAYYGGIARDYYGADGIHVRDVNPEEGRIIAVREGYRAGENGAGFFSGYAIDIIDNEIDTTADDGIDVRDSSSVFIYDNEIINAGLGGYGYSDYSDSGYNNTQYYGSYYGGYYGYDREEAFVSDYYGYYGGFEGYYSRESFSYYSSFSNNVGGYGDYDGGDAIFVENVQSEGFPTEGYYGSGGDFTAYDVVVYDNDIDFTGDDGIEVVRSGRTLIKDNEIDDVGLSYYSGYDSNYFGGYYGGDYGSGYYNYYGSYYSFGAGDRRYGNDGIHVREVIAEGTDPIDDYYGSYETESFSDIGIPLFEGPSVEIYGNEINNTSDDGIQVLRSGHTVIGGLGEDEGNTINNTGLGDDGYFGGYYGGYYGSTGQIDNYGGDGIHVKNGFLGEQRKGRIGRIVPESDDYFLLTDVEIVGNEVNNAGDDGIEAEGAYNLLVDKNIVTDSYDEGILILSGDSFSNGYYGDDRREVETFLVGGSSGIFTEIPDQSVTVTNNEVSDSGSNGLHVKGAGHDNVDVFGNTFTDNGGITEEGETFGAGARFESGEIDLRNEEGEGEEPNRFFDTDDSFGVGLQFENAPGILPSQLTIEGVTLGSTEFSGYDPVGNFYVRFEDGAILEDDDTVIIIDAGDVSFDGVVPNSFPGRVADQSIIDDIEENLYDADDSIVNGRGQIFTLVPPNVTIDNFEDFIRLFGGPGSDPSGLNLTVLGLPPVELGPGALANIVPFAGEPTAEELAGIAPAAGDEEDGTAPQDIEPAAGGDDVACWGDALAAAEDGSTVSFNFGGTFEESLADATNCATEDI